MGSKHVIVIGAGPGGLTAAMILASKGFEVSVFEKEERVGGRNASLVLDGKYTFDVGPTFLMMRDILEGVFETAGRRAADYLDIRSLDPLYRLHFGEGQSFFPTHDTEKMREQMDRLFPGSWEGFRRFLAREKEKYERVSPCLQIPYGSFGDMMSLRLVRAARFFDAHRALFDYLGDYFKYDNLRISFTFQAKYLGMSPWICPATFSMISYIENSGGIHHPIGGLNKISEAMAKVVTQGGGKIHLGKPVRRVTVRKGRAVGVELQDGSHVASDYVVVNADFGHAVTSGIFPRSSLRKWTPEALETKGFSCSTFMLYLGVNRRYDDMCHHNICFAPDYKRNVQEIAEKFVLSEDPSIYVQNASVTDPTLAPEGHSAIYLLVPIANNRSQIDWEAIKGGYRDKVLELAETRCGLTDLRKHIVCEKMITPKDWQTSGVHLGATFNLAHNVRQMLWFRPHNEFEEIDKCYLVGGGTHPGSGLPTIYESGRISAGLILKDAEGR